MSEDWEPSAELKRLDAENDKLWAEALQVPFGRLVDSGPIAAELETSNVDQYWPFERGEVQE